jgi:microcystin-dependent protein
MEKYLIIIIIIIVIYQLCCNCIQTDVKETFTNSQSVTGIDDNNAINTLAALAKDLQSPAGVTIPGNLNLKNKVVLVADDNVLRLKTPDLSSNSSLNVKDLKVDGVSNLTPKGVIIAWMYTNENIAENGKEIIPPPTWALCDGTKGTPDLRGRFILGAGVGGKGSANPNAIALTERVFGTYGGFERVKLDITEIPPHSHHFADNAPAGYGSWGDHGRRSNGIRDWQHIGSNTHNAGGAADGQAAYHENMPPFYVLAYIMKL